MCSIIKPRVPEGLRDLMKDLTREILKEKPTDIYNFAEYYFLSRLDPEKEHYKVRKFEENSGKYDFSYIQNYQHYQIPVGLIYSIIPEGLTNLIKDLIKAILREQPENLCHFAVEYFRHLKSTTKNVNQSENTHILKEINYSAYENYFKSKEHFLYTPYVKCKCGRFLGESQDNYNVNQFSSISMLSQGVQKDDTKDKNKSQRMSKSDSTFTEKYINSVILIQQYFRRYLKTRNATVATNAIPKDLTITELSKQTSNRSNPIVSQLHLNQLETENVSEDASYTSASTALLSESGRDNSDVSTTESILTKTIIENEEIENNETNFPTYLKRNVSLETIGQVHSKDTTNNDSVSTLIEEEFNANEVDERKLIDTQSDEQKNLDIVHEIKQGKSFEDNKEELSELKNFHVNKIADNTSKTDGTGIFFEDNNEMNEERYSNEREKKQNDIVKPSVQTEKYHLKSTHKISIDDTMNTDSEIITNIVNSNSSSETDVILSELQVHTNNSAQNFEIDNEKKIFDNENNNDSDSSEKNQQNLQSIISSDHITNSEVSTEGQKHLKIETISTDESINFDSLKIYSNKNDIDIDNSEKNDENVEKYDCRIEGANKAETLDETNFLNTSDIKNVNVTDNFKVQRERNKEYVYNDLNDIRVVDVYSNISTKEVANGTLIKNSSLSIDGAKNTDDHKNVISNLSNLNSDERGLTALGNEQKIQTTDVTTQKISDDQNEKNVDLKPTCEISEHTDKNNESEILGENQHNLHTLYEGNNIFNEHDTFSKLISNEEDKKNNVNRINNSLGKPNYIEANIYSQPESELHSSNIESSIITEERNNDDNTATSSIAIAVKTINSSEIFSKDDIVTNFEKVSDNSTNSEKPKVFDDFEIKEKPEDNMEKLLSITKNSLEKPNTELYETDAIDKPKADMTVEATSNKIDNDLETEINENSSIIIKDHEDQKLKDTFDEHKVEFEIPLMSDKKHEQSLELSHMQLEFEVDKKDNETNINQGSAHEEEYKLKEAFASLKDSQITDFEKEKLAESQELVSKPQTNITIENPIDNNNKNNIEAMNESIQCESAYNTLNNLSITDNSINEKMKFETKNAKSPEIGDNQQEDKKEDLNQNNDIKEKVTITINQNDSNSLVNEEINSNKNKELNSNKTHENYESQNANAVYDTDNDILNRNITEISQRPAKEDPTDSDKSKQILDQNIVMEKDAGTTEINKDNLRGSKNDMKNYETIRNETTDNLKNEINSDGIYEVRNEESLESTKNNTINNTISHKSKQISTASEVNCTVETEQEQTIKQYISMEEEDMKTKINHNNLNDLDNKNIYFDNIVTSQKNKKDDQSDEKKSGQSQNMEQEGDATEMTNSKNTITDASVENDTLNMNVILGINMVENQINTTLRDNNKEDIGNKEKLRRNQENLYQNSKCDVLNETISNSNTANDTVSGTSQKTEKDNQSDKRIANQSHDMEKKEEATEIIRIDSENTRCDASDNFENIVVDSRENDISNNTISDKIVYDENKAKQNPNFGLDEQNLTEVNLNVSNDLVNEKVNSDHTIVEISENSHSKNFDESVENHILNKTIFGKNSITNEEFSATTSVKDNKEEDTKILEQKQTNCIQNTFINKEGQTVEVNKADLNDSENKVINYKSTINETIDNLKIQINSDGTQENHTENVVDGTKNDISKSAISHITPFEIINAEINPNLKKSVDLQASKKTELNKTISDNTINENNKNTNDVNSTEDDILNTTILDNMVADEHTSATVPINEVKVLCNDKLEQNEKNLDCIIDTHEEVATTKIYRNYSKESVNQKTNSENPRIEFTDNLKPQAQDGNTVKTKENVRQDECNNNLWEKNLDQNIPTDRTYSYTMEKTLNPSKDSNDEKVNSKDFRSETTDDLKAKTNTDITHDQNTVESTENDVLEEIITSNDISNKTILENNTTIKQIGETSGKKNKKADEKNSEEYHDQNTEIKKEKRETTLISKTDSHKSVKEKTNSENDRIETDNNLKTERSCNRISFVHDGNYIKSTENYNLNNSISDSIITYNQKDTNDEKTESRQNLGQNIDTEDENKIEMKQIDSKIADTIIKETDNLDTEINPDETPEFHDKNVVDSIENDVFDQRKLEKILTEKHISATSEKYNEDVSGNKQILEENLDQNSSKSGIKSNSSRAIHYENKLISDSITKGDTKKNSEKSQLELIESHNLNKVIFNQNSIEKQSVFNIDENESIEMNDTTKDKSDQNIDINKEKESKLNEIICDDARCDELHNERLNFETNREESITAYEANSQIDSTNHNKVESIDEQRVGKNESESNYGSLYSLTPPKNPIIFNENSNITDSDLITDLKEPSSILPNTDGLMEYVSDSELETKDLSNILGIENDKKESISDKTNIELRQTELETNSNSAVNISYEGDISTSNNNNADFVQLSLASTSNKTNAEKEQPSSICISINKCIESNIDSYVLTKDSGVDELDQDNIRVQPKTKKESSNQIDSESQQLPALIKSNEIEKKCEVNDDDSLTKIASKAIANTSEKEQKQEMDLANQIITLHHYKVEYSIITDVTETIDNLENSITPTNLIKSNYEFVAKELSEARQLGDLNANDQLLLRKSKSKQVEEQTFTEKINKTNHLEQVNENYSDATLKGGKTNIENNFCHENTEIQKSLTNQDEKLKKDTEINKEEKSNEESKNGTKSDENIIKDENIKETRTISDVENDVKRKIQGQQEIIVHQEQHNEVSPNKLPDDADGKGDIKDEATTLNIGNKTPKSVIGIQNFNIDRIRFYNEGLLGSISGQRFAETHLRSFWKEYLMNNSKPLGHYDSETDEIYSKQLLDSEKNEALEPLSTSYFDKNELHVSEENTNVEPIIIKETTKYPKAMSTNDQDLSPTYIIKKDLERIPKYFYGVVEKLEDNKTIHPKPKNYKEPLAFTIPFNDINKTYPTKIDAGKKFTTTNSNNETHITNLDLTSCASIEQPLKTETSAKHFECIAHDVDLDITYEPDKILCLKNENDLQNNLGENAEHLNDSISDYSLTPEPMLQTIIEVSESETPRSLRQLQPNNEGFLTKLDNTFDLTIESKENNSLISEELLPDEYENAYKLVQLSNLNGHTDTTGGIYEYSTNELDNVDKTLFDNAHVSEINSTSPNNDTFDEVLKEFTDEKNQTAYSQDRHKSTNRSNIHRDAIKGHFEELASNTNKNYLIDSSNKIDKKNGSTKRNTDFNNTENKNSVDNKEESKTIDYNNKNKSDLDPSVDSHSKDEALPDYKQIVATIPIPTNNDSLDRDFKEIAAKKIQKSFRHHLQKMANRDKENYKYSETDIVDSLGTKFNKIKSPEININNSEETFKDEQDKKFKKFSKNSSNLNEDNSESVKSTSNSETKNINKSTEISCNSDNKNNDNQILHGIQKSHKQLNLNKTTSAIETSSIIENLKDNLNPANSSNESLYVDLKEISAKKIQRAYREYLQKTATTDNKDNFEPDDNIKALDVELLSSTVNSFNEKFNKIEIPGKEIEINKAKNENSTYYRPTTSKGEKNSKGHDKTFDEFSKNSIISGEQESDSINSTTNSEMKNINKSIENSYSYECNSTVTNNLRKDYNSNNKNNSNQSRHKTENYHEQDNFNEKTSDMETSSITGNSQGKPDCLSQDPSAVQVADKDVQFIIPIMNADDAARIIQLFFKKNMKRKSKVNTSTDLLKTHWFVGDERIVANEESLPLSKANSEISFDETEAFVELSTNIPQYLVDSNSSEAIDVNNFSRTPTAPITNRSSSNRSCSEDSLVQKCINLSKATVLDDVAQSTEDTAPNIEIQSSGVVGHRINERKARYVNLIDQFITAERFYSGIVNRNYSISDIKDIKFPSSNITEITEILTEFSDSQSENLTSDIKYEKLEEPCIKESIEEELSSTSTLSSSDIDDAEDSLSIKTVKLQKPEIAIIRMQQRRNSTSKISNLDNLKDYNFDEPSVVSIDNLDTDEEGIVVAHLQREETRESTGQSDVDVIIGSTVKDDVLNSRENFNFDSTLPSKGSLKRVYTIAGEAEAKSLLKNVTIDESIKYIEPPNYELNNNSLCLDDETTANIRHKMMAYSLSEADSDVLDRTADTSELRIRKYDDFNISTALIDNDDTSTETESTTVSAVTKIQVGIQGSNNSSKVSVGNSAISESLEHLVKEAAAKRIQKMYRQHCRLKAAKENDRIKSSPEYTKSIENSLAQKRSIMLQRGDALRNGSSPEDGTSSSNGSGSENGKTFSKIESCSQNKTIPEQEFNAIFTDKGTSSCSLPSSAKSAAAIRAKKIEDNKRRWIAMRQNSMPVQIDSEVLRVIPKYIRKKIKSAEGEKKKDRRRLLMD